MRILIFLALLISSVPAHCDISLYQLNFSQAMTQDLNMGGKNITNFTTVIDLSGVLNKSGGTLTGNINANGHEVSGIAPDILTSGANLSLTNSSESVIFAGNATNLQIINLTNCTWTQNPIRYIFNIDSYNVSIDAPDGLVDGWSIITTNHTGAGVMLIADGTNYQAFYSNQDDWYGYNVA